MKASSNQNSKGVASDVVLSRSGIASQAHCLSKRAAEPPFLANDKSAAPYRPLALRERGRNLTTP